MDSITAFDDCGEDIISQLPEELLHQILFFLPTKYIVRTSALSTRWRHLWTFFTIVNFDLSSWKEEPDTAGIRKLRLHLEIYTSPLHTHSDILGPMSLIPNSDKHKTEELVLSFPIFPKLNLLSLTVSLFNSNSLTSLKLQMNQSGINNLPNSICFPRLKILNLARFKFHDQRSAQFLFSCSPVLEDLVLDNCSWHTINGITISITTLQKLTIYHYKSSDDLLKICCPNLQSLKFWSCSLFRLLLCNLPSLAKARVEVVPLEPSYKQIQLAHCTLMLLERIQGVKSLKLSYDTLQTISGAENFPADYLPTFCNLTHLKVKVSEACEEDNSEFSVATLMHILEKSPNLQSLQFPHGLPLDLLEEEKEFPKNIIPVCLRRSLEAFGMLRFRGCPEEVRFLKLILKNANALKWFTVYCSEALSKDQERKERIGYELKQLLSTNCSYVFL